jgi:hypothetical protein
MRDFGRGATPQAWRCIRLSVAIVLAMASAAYAQKENVLELRRTGDKTEVVSGLDRVGPNELLRVRCLNFSCAEIQAGIDTLGSTLTPKEGAAPETAKEKVFSLPEGAAKGSKVQMRACPSGTSSAECLKTTPILEIAFGQGDTSEAPDRRTTMEFCSEVGTKQVSELIGKRGREDFTVVVFDETGPCYLSRQFGAEGDPIAVGFVSSPGPTVSLDLDPCNTLAAAPKVLVSADVSSLQIQSRVTGQVLVAEWFPPLRRCFGTSAGIKLSVTPPGQAAKPLAYTLKQFERYRATLQIGVAASELHQQTFGLRPDGNAKRIIETSEDERGPEYVGSVVLYAIPRYFARRRVQAPCFYHTPNRRECQEKMPPPEGESYYGRDPVNDNGIADRVGLLFGAGLSQPGRRFLVGGSFEVIVGVNVFLTREFVRLPELEGVAVDDVFAGEAATIPIRDHWRQAWTAGVSLDARYALALFGRK